MMRSLSLLVAAIATVAVCLASPGPSTDPAALGLTPQWPTELGHWISRPIPPSEAERNLLPADTVIEKALYRSPVSELAATIVLSGADRTSLHRPEVCLAAQGWAIVDRENRVHTLPEGPSLDVCTLLIQRESHQARYTYWYVSDDASTPDHVVRVLHTLKRNLIDQANPRWACIGLLSPGPETDAIDDFISTVIPEIQHVF